MWPATPPTIPPLMQLFASAPEAEASAIGATHAALKIHFESFLLARFISMPRRSFPSRDVPEQLAICSSGEFGLAGESL